MFWFGTARAGRIGSHCWPRARWLIFGSIFRDSAVAPGGSGAGWQWVFPQRKLAGSHNRGPGKTTTSTPPLVAASRENRRWLMLAVSKAASLPLPFAPLCQRKPSGTGPGHPYDSGVAWPSGCEHTMIYTQCAEQQAPWAVSSPADFM